MTQLVQKTQSLKQILSNYAFLEIFLLGVISGMPFSILYTNLLVMLKDIGFNLSTATGIAVALMPYSLKFLWAPIVDGKNVIFLSKFGRRKSWMICSTIFSIAILLSFHYVASFNNFQYILIAAFSYGIACATYDIAYDAWRIERVHPDEMAMSGAVAIFGWRIGALITGAGVLYAVGVTEDWNLTLMGVAGVFGIGILFMLTVPDLGSKTTKSHSFNLIDNVINPFKDFLTKPLSKHILIAIILYKAGEAMIGFISTPFYLELGFTKPQIASVVKVFGVAATTFGTFAGGFICYRLGYMKGLITCGIIQMISNLAFIWMHGQGPILTSLFVIVAIDNFSGGMGSAALVGYLGSLCNRNYTATQYALLSSATTLINHSLVAYSGTLVENLGWNMFFVSTVLMSLPALGMLYYVYKKSISQ
jgi:MFS transporter, PAT family, beta-lactamase induction signal transducer AmpG